MGFWCVTEAWPDATVQWFKGNDSQPISCSQLREKFIPVSPDTPSNTVYTCVGVNKVERTSKSVSFQGTYIYK